MDITQASYVNEIAERCHDTNDIVITCLSDATTNELSRVAIEAAYRRGFQHGALYAIDAINKGKSVARVQWWVESELYKWRYTKHNGQFELPPHP